MENVVRAGHQWALSCRPYWRSFYWHNLPEPTLARSAAPNTDAERRSECFIVIMANLYNLRNCDTTIQLYRSWKSLSQLMPKPSLEQFGWVLFIRTRLPAKENINEMKWADPLFERIGREEPAALAVVDSLIIGLHVRVKAQQHNAQLVFLKI